MIERYGGDHLAPQDDRREWILDQERHMRGVSESWLGLKAIPEAHNTRPLVLSAVAHYGYALRYASLELRGDKEVVLAAVAHDGYALRYASEELRGDKEAVLVA